MDTHRIVVFFFFFFFFSACVRRCTVRRLHFQLLSFFFFLQKKYTKNSPFFCDNIFPSSTAQLSSDWLVFFLSLFSPTNDHFFCKKKIPLFFLVAIFFCLLHHFFFVPLHWFFFLPCEVEGGIWVCVGMGGGIRGSMFFHYTCSP